MEKVGRDRSMCGIFPGDIHLITFSTLANGDGIYNSPTRIYSTSKAREGCHVDRSVRVPLPWLHVPFLHSCHVESFPTTGQKNKGRFFNFFPLKGQAYAHAHAF
jgi:hypothetical protein